MKKKKSPSGGKIGFHWTNWASLNNAIGIFTHIIMLPMKAPVMVSYSLAPTSELCARCEFSDKPFFKNCYHLIYFPV